LSTSCERDEQGESKYIPIGGPLATIASNVIKSMPVEAIRARSMRAVTRRTGVAISRGSPTYCSEDLKHTARRISSDNAHAGGFFWPWQSDECRAEECIYGRLAPHRRLFGSGNIVHNLHAYAWGRHAPDPYDWAARFEDSATQSMLSGDIAPLINYEQLGPDAQLAIPTPEHFLPLLYVLGTQHRDNLSFPVSGFDGGSISMLCVQVG
jgi:hypothetical protein